MEDIDAAFSQTLNRESTDSSASDTNSGDDDDDDAEKLSKSKTGNASPRSMRSASRITLSGLLNALDGVGAQEGRILFATTNKYGRVDIHLEFKLSSRYQARELFRCFYMPDSALEEGKKTIESDEDSGYSSDLKG
jgi:mitochondrial chaperone BCS1